MQARDLSTCLASHSAMRHCIAKGISTAWGGENCLLQLSGLVVPCDMLTVMCNVLVLPWQAVAGVEMQSQINVH